MSKVKSKSKHNGKQKSKPPSTGLRIARGVGGLLGSLVGQADLGRSAGSWLAKVTGMGDYTLHTNAFTKSSSAVPSFEYAADGSVTVTHREYVSDIKGSELFQSTNFDICPSNPGLFPWLSIQSMCYDQYEFLGLLAAYVPVSGNAVASTNNTLGSVTMSTEYDLSRNPFASKKEMCEYMFTTSGVPSEHQMHPVECNPKRDTVNARYLGSIWRETPANTATFATANTLSDNLRCTGRLQIATQGQQAVTTVGELWVTYKVKLSKPRIPPSGFPHGYLQASGNGTGIQAGFDHMFANATVFNTSTAFSSGITLDDDTIYFNQTPPGTIVRLFYTADSRNSTTNTFSVGAITYGGCQVVNGFSPGQTPKSQMYFGSGSFQVAFLTSIVINTLGATLAFSPPPVTGSAINFLWELNLFTFPRNYPVADPVPLSLSTMTLLESRVKRLEDSDEKFVAVQV